MNDILGDIRFAVRSWRRFPLHTLATVLILGVGIGAVTLMFSVLNASVLRPLPFPHPERLVWLWKASDEVRRNSVSYDDFRDYRDALDALEDVAAYQLFSPRPLLSGPEEGTRVQGTQVTPNLFAVLGVNPAVGRPFRWEEAVDGGPAVTILSHAFWQGQFGGDPSILGRTLTLDGQPTEVVGIMPAGFAFPDDGVQLWLPTRDGAGATQGRGNNNFFVVGRLKDDVTLDLAQTQVDAVAGRIQEANPEYARWYHWLEPLHTVLFGDTRTILLLLLGIVSLVPLLACANVASLTLARAAARTTELATRLALGAGRARVVRQLVLESVVLALAGGALGVVVAEVGGRVLRSVGPASLPRLSEIGVDPTVLSFAFLASLLTVPLFGVLPALKGSGLDLAATLRFGGGRGGSLRRSRARSAMVVSQVALSLALLIASGLLYRSFQRLNAEDPGFSASSLLTAGLQLPGHEYASPEELKLAWDQTLERIAGLPGVRGVAAADWLPVTPGGGPWNTLLPEGTGESDDGVPGRRKFVNPDYFAALGIPLVAGRPFVSDDLSGSEPVMIVSQTLATALFGGGDPLGQTVGLWGQPFRVVGVSASVDEAGMGTEGRPAFFLSTGQFPQERLRVAIRTESADAAGLAATVRRVLREQDPDIVLSDVQTMEARIGGTLAQPRFRAGVVGAFALVGLLLAAVGLYGVLAYLVTLRRHEIGIRLAVGAGRGAVLGLVVAEGLKLVGAGALLGLALGAVLSMLMRGLLFGVPLVDPASVGGATLILFAVATAAGILPALRAVRVDPLEALRAE